MVMASTASQPLSEQRHADVMRHVVEELLARDRGDRHARVFPRPGSQISGGDQEFGILLIQFIAGELFQHKPVEGLVGVERTDDIVAIPPGVRPLKVVREPGCICVTDHVEPMLGLAFTVVRAGEQFGNGGLEGLLSVSLLSVSLSHRLSVFVRRRRDGETERRREGQKILQVLRAWRQARQVERESPQQRAGIGGRGERVDAGGVKLGQQKTVDRIANCGLRIADWGNRRTGNRLICPQVGANVGAIVPVGREAAAGGHSSRHALRDGILTRSVRSAMSDAYGVPLRSLGDPSPHNVDLFRGQAVVGLRRHLQRVVLPGDGAEERAFVRLAGDNRRFAALAPTGGSVECAEIKFAL